MHCLSVGILRWGVLHWSEMHILLLCLCAVCDGLPGIIKIGQPVLCRDQIFIHVMMHGNRRRTVWLVWQCWGQRGCHRGDCLQVRVLSADRIKIGSSWSLWRPSPDTLSRASTTTSLSTSLGCLHTTRRLRRQTPSTRPTEVRLLQLILVLQKVPSEGS